MSASPPTTSTPRSLWARIGIPTLAGNRKFVTATSVDSIGNGLILAFTVVYFVNTTSVSVAAVGAAMTLARLFALPTSTVVGPLIDRFTARRTAVVGNLVSAVGYTGFLAAHHTWSIVLVVFLVQVGHTTYWTSSSALVALASPAEERTRWFGFVYALRNTGLGIGGAVGAFAFGLGAATGLHLIAVANAVSFLIAAALLAAWRPRQSAEARGAAPAPEPATGAARYSTVLRDHRYTTLIAINTTLVFAQMLIKVLLAIYIVDALHRGAWLAGALIVLSTIQITLTQTALSRRMERYRPTRVIAAAALLDAAAFGIFALLYAAPNWLVIGGLFVAMFVFTVGEIVGFPAIDSLSVAMAPEHIRGRYLAMYQLSWTVGEIVAPAVLTFLLARGAVLPMVFLLLLSLVAVPLLLSLERRTAAPDRPAAAATLPAEQG